MLHPHRFGSRLQSKGCCNLYLGRTQTWQLPDQHLQQVKAAKAIVPALQAGCVEATGELPCPGMHLLSVSQAAARLGFHEHAALTYPAFGAPCQGKNRLAPNACLLRAGLHSQQPRGGKDLCC
jgi:hypothetical protein